MDTEAGPVVPSSCDAPDPAMRTNATAHLRIAMSRTQPFTVGATPVRRLTRADGDRIVDLLAWLECAARTQRRSLALHLQLGLAPEEIARVLGESPAAVAYLLPPAVRELGRSQPCPAPVVPTPAPAAVREPGWYRDPRDPRLHRHWDGETWRPWTPTPSHG